MGLIQLLVIVFGVLSAGVWVVALFINALVFIQRVLMKADSPLHTVGVVALIAGVWVFFAAKAIWPQIGMGWIVLVVLPQVFAIPANAVVASGASRATETSGGTGENGAGGSDNPES
ncbi:MAG: hypothetical protein AAGH99_12080 [Planctomycetota bacterium]